MALDNFTVSKNTGYVEQANGGMSGAQIDDIERRAKAQVTTAREETARAESAEKEAAGKGGPSKGNAEANLYGNIALDMLAPGIKMMSTAADFVTQRHEDRKAPSAHAAGGAQAGVSSGRSVSIEEDIASANRKPGAYRMPAQQREFGNKITDTIGKPGVTIRTQATQGEDLMARTNIATTSLKDQGKDALKSWDVKEGSTKMAGVQLAKKLTFGQELANEQALQSALIARQQYTATIGHAMRMAPGMGMNGPSFKGADIMKMAQEEADLNRWRTQK